VPQNGLGLNITPTGIISVKMPNQAEMEILGQLETANFINPASNQDWIPLGSTGEIYTVGFVITEMFTALKGPEAQMEIVRQIAQGKSMDEAFESVFGTPWKTAVPIIARTIAKERANEIQHSHNLFFSNSIDNSINEYDIAIIATNANVREQIIKKLLEEVRISNMILEKVLFQNIDAYSAIEDLLSQKNANTWVNHPRRMFPIYQKIKQQLSENNQEKIYVAITGYDWGLGCNGLHFIDLVCFLKNTAVESIQTDLLDQKIQKSN
jgi:hypothetical protein